MVARGDIVWADAPEPMGRRPVCVLTRDSAIPVLERITVAGVTRTIRGLPSEVAVGEGEGLPAPSVINCDDIARVPKLVLDPDRVGRLDEARRIELDRALRFALDIRY